MIDLIDDALQQLRDALKDPWFDEISDETWFHCADTRPEEFVHTLEVWLAITDALHNWALQYSGVGEQPHLPANYSRITRITQWVLGDRSTHRRFDTSPLSEWLSFYEDYCSFVDLEVEKREVKERGEPDIDDWHEVADVVEFGYEQSRTYGRAWSLVDRALHGQIRGYRSIVDAQRRGYTGGSYEFFNDVPQHPEALHPDFDISPVAPSTCASTQPAKNGDSDFEPDGPADIYTWRWDGEKVLVGEKDRMKPSAWKLAEYLWKRRKRRVAIKDLIGDGNLCGIVSDGTVAKHGRTAAQWFADHEIPLDIRSADKHIWMERTDTTE